MLAVYRFTLFLVILSLWISCSSSTNQTSVEPTTVNFLVTAEGINEKLTADQDTLEISSVRIVLKELRLGFDAGAPVMVRENDVAVSFDEMNRGDSVSIANTEIPGNIYRSSGFSVALPQNIDVEHPEYSIFVTGMYSGQNFEFGSDTTFASDQNFNQQQDIPLQNAQLKVTISFDLLEWFRGDQNDILNPREEAFKDEIEKNIRPSFRIDMSSMVN